MKLPRFCLALFLALGTAAALPAAGSTGRVYELRTYTAAPGKAGALQARFRDHGTDAARIAMTLFRQLIDQH